jgi:hypothetical protein
MLEIRTLLYLAYNPLLHPNPAAVITLVLILLLQLDGHYNWYYQLSMRFLLLI